MAAPSGPREIRWASVSLRPRSKGHHLVRLDRGWVRTLALDHLLKLESLYCKLICQASEQFSLFRVTRPPAHAGEICGIGAELFQSFPEVLHGNDSGPRHHLASGGVQITTETRYGLIVNRSLPQFAACDGLPSYGTPFRRLTRSSRSPSITGRASLPYGTLSERFDALATDDCSIVCLTHLRICKPPVVGRPIVLGRRETVAVAVVARTLACGKIQRTRDEKRI